MDNASIEASCMQARPSAIVYNMIAAGIPGPGVIIDSIMTITAQITMYFCNDFVNWVYSPS